jgi:small subunit ribosomal protein S2
MAESNTLQDLLKSGAHFGHLTRRWNPKMKDFIFMERNGIHIIDLKKTVNYLEEALENVRKMAAAGKTILFVGTKKQAQDIVKTEAIRCGMPYVTHRWLGGMMTNFSTVRRSIKRMQEIEQMRNDGTFDELTKKERLMLEREHDKLEKTLGGIAGMNRLPGAVFIVDTIKESIAVNEAVKLHIPIVAMADTNSDPDVPDYIVPCNDDSARTIQLITSKIADAIIEGNAEREAQNEEELMQQASQEAAKAEKEDKSEKKDDKSSQKRRSRRKKKSDDKKSDDKKAKKEDKDSEKAEESSDDAGDSDENNDEEE